MLSASFQSSCTAMVFLAVNILPNPTASYPVVLNITSDGNIILLGLGTKNARNFQSRRCICDKQGCDITSHILDTYASENKALSSDYAHNYRGDYFLQCKYVYSRSQGRVLCTGVEATVCPHTSCTINIIIHCNNKNAVLIWDSAQNPSVLSFTDVPVIDCCQSSTTTTEVTTFSTTTPSTTFTTIQSSTDPTTITVIEDSSTTSVAIPQSISLTPDEININNTQLRTSTQQNGSNDTQSGLSNQQNGNDDSAKISGQHIGIIVGTAVAAVLVTVAVMCVWFRLKTRREKNRRKDRAEGTMPVSGNDFDTQLSNLSNSITERSNKASTIALASPPVESAERESRLTHIAGDYTYIDIHSASSNKSNTALTSQSPSLHDNHVDFTTVEAATGIQDNDYSHLGANTVRQENPYNLLDHQKSYATFQPVIIPVVPLDRQQRTYYLQTPNTTDHHTFRKTQQGPEACKNHDLYSNLGESRPPHENTYNSFNSLNDGPIRDAGLEQPRDITKPNLQAISENTPSHNGHLQVFTNISQHNSLDMNDAVPYTYTQVIPKTSQQQYNDGKQLQKKNNLAILTASTADNLTIQTPSTAAHLMPQSTKSCQPSRETNVVTETVADIKENNTHSGVGSAAYSMHDIQDKKDVSLSLEAATYANVH